MYFLYAYWQFLEVLINRIIKGKNGFISNLRHLAAKIQVIFFQNYNQLSSKITYIDTSINCFSRYRNEGPNNVDEGGGSVVVVFLKHSVKLLFIFLSFNHRYMYFDINLSGCRC